jgi:5-hydroxyisourate hydrolase
MTKITTHVLNTSKGIPATGIKVILYTGNGNSWEQLAIGVTDQSGRVGDFGVEESRMTTGTYKLTFDTGAYFEAMAVASFYPFVDIVFVVAAQEHYHVPLLLNPFGYSTYRGS